MMGRTRIWAVTVAAGAAVAVGAIGTAAMGDGKHDSGDQRESHDQRDGDWGDSGDSRHDKDRKLNLRAHLSGYEEDPLTISTPGSGRFEARVDEKRQEITYRLSYEDLKDVQQAHIHFGGRHQSGGVAVFLCSNIKDGKGGPSKDVQSCPQAPATIKGTIKPEDVVGPADQGIEPKEFDELVDAIEAGVTYVNVHTKKYPNGEIRGQIKVEDERDGKHEDERDGKHEDRNWDASDSRAWESDDEGRHEDSDWGSDKGDEDSHWGSGKGDEGSDWGSGKGDEGSDWGSDKGDEGSDWGSDKGDEKGSDWGSDKGDEGSDWGSDKGDEKGSDKGSDKGDKGSEKGDDHDGGWADDEA
ncbi:CHRD domain-containing protein [Micromonospora krabiensis]|uniref:CHRD domain-containing protein n=1 Tax=Micromonospora krabiensis TaxID=307121 RepID=A0A1C3N5A2_9ACTN|nr:CHRD domain-containing protein [Micromonospora krabiensis]SBV27748.1 CHRD domain-containing protein [Micromonospora krabiensis]